MSEVKLKKGLIKELCRCGCQGCYYENKKDCPYKECSTPDEEYIFVEGKSEKKESVKIKQTQKKLNALF